MPLMLDSGDAINGWASVADKVDYTIHGLDNSVLKQLADGQLAVATAALYTADSVDVVTSITLVNTHTVAVTVDLTLTPSGGTARRLIPKAMTLGIAYSAVFTGNALNVYDATGKLQSTVLAVADFLDDTAGGTDALVTKAPTSNVMYDHGVAVAGVHSFDKSCHVYNSTNISIPHATTTSLTFDTERWDTDTIHSIVTNTGRLTCKTAGIYLIIGVAECEPNAAGRRLGQFFLNAATSYGRQEWGLHSDTYPTFSIATLLQLAVNDYVEFVVYQSSGVALNVVYDAGVSPEFMMVRIA